MQQIGFLMARFMVFILALRIDAAKLVGKGIDETRVEGIKFVQNQNQRFLEIAVSKERR